MVVPPAAKGFGFGDFSLHESSNRLFGQSTITTLDEHETLLQPDLGPRFLPRLLGTDSATDA